MSIKLILLGVFSLSIMSCSSVYKNTQTPDDVYYSPARDFADVDTKEEVRRYDPEERQIRMRAYDSRWRTLDDRYYFNYRYSPYQYDFGYNGYSPYYSPSIYSGYHGYHNYGYYGGYGGGYYYNPYYSYYPVYSIGVVSVKPINRTPRKANLSGYGQQNSRKTISSYQTSNNNRYQNSNRTYNNSNSNSRKSSTRYESPTRSSQTPVRTYTPSSQNSSSSGSSAPSRSSSGGSVERPSRGNN